MTEMKLDAARAIVQDLISLLAPTAEAVQLVGSIRRDKKIVKDGEIVIIPTPTTYRAIEWLLQTNQATKATYSDGRQRWGDLYRGINFKGLRVELFFATPINYGYIVALRTGPSEANIDLMARLGRTPIRCIEGQVWVADDWRRARAGKVKGWISDTKRRVIVPDEMTWFRLLGLRYVLPAARDESMYHRINVDLSGIDVEDDGPTQGTLF